MDIINKVEEFLSTHNLLNSKEKILVAFSGGYDSMCLLDICNKLNLNVTAIHLNHNWRGEESDKEENNCRIFCQEKAIEFYSEKLPTGVPQTETFARMARYDFFEKCATKFNSKIIFTAHNKNDNAETLLYRIAKGTGIVGLSGIASVRGQYYRPLINTQREEIEEYCNKNLITPNEDSSNNNTKYQRNFIRHNILPELKKINPNIIDTINTLSEVAKLDNEIIEEYLKTLNNPYKTSNFKNYSFAVKSRLCYNLFLQNGLEYDREKINRVIKFIEENKDSKSGKTLSISDKLWLFVNKDTIETITKTKKNETEVNIKECGSYELDNIKFNIEEFTNKLDKFPNDKERIAYANLTDIKEITLRYRKEGDFIKPLGCSGTQKIKKYFNEKKVPKHLKDKLPLLASGSEILWIPTLGISDKIKVIDRPTHILKLIDK